MVNTLASIADHNPKVIAVFRAVDVSTDGFWGICVAPLWSGKSPLNVPVLAR